MKRGAIDWDDVPLGRYDDVELARRLGTTRQAVGRQRNAKGIPPLSRAHALPRGMLTAMEREDLDALELGLEQLMDDARPTLSIATATAVGRTPCWLVETMRARTSGGNGKDGGRATAFRFRAPGRRQWTPRMGPADARAFLLLAGWADHADQRVRELREAAAPTNEGATA